MSTESPFPNDDTSETETVASSVPAAFDEPFADDDGVLYDEEVTPEYGILGFTLRELLIVGVWLVAFVASFFPFAADTSIWGTGIQWILPIGVPTAAVFLLVLRRFSPDGIRRVGSLGIDQFASVAFSVAAVYWLTDLWTRAALSIQFGVFGLSWNGILQLIAALALVVLTVFAPLIPGLKEDFHGRLVTLAHRNANPARPVIARPRSASDSVPSTEPHDADASEAAAGPVADPYAAPAPEDYGVADTAADAVDTNAFTTTSYGSVRESDLDQELSGQHATDEVAHLGTADRVSLSGHASGGGTGTEQTTAGDDYAPSYARSSRGQEPEIVSDTGSIESMLGTTSQPQTGAVDTAAGFPDDRATDLDATNPREPAPAPQPFWILAPTERDVHDERGEPIFRIGPSAWALVIEDRGGAYVVRHDDGRIGYLHDIADITKG